MNLKKNIKMDVHISNTAELKEFVLNSSIGIKDKIELTSRCLNIIILQHIHTTSELIDIINESSHNKNRIIVFDKGLDPLNDN